MSFPKGKGSPTLLSIGLQGPELDGAIRSQTLHFREGKGLAQCPTQAISDRYWTRSKVC